MSPTEFSNYIKQRAMQQQIHHHHHHHQQQHQQAGLPVSQSSPTSRSLSPGIVGSQQSSPQQVQQAQQQPQQAQQAQQQQQHTDPSAYFFPGPYHPQFPTHRNIFESSSHGGYLPDLYGAKFPSSYLDPTSIGHQFYGSVGGGSSQSSGNLGPVGSTASNATTATQQDKTALVDGLNNFGLSSVTPYTASQYQHLLVAN